MIFSCERYGTKEDGFKRWIEGGVRGEGWAVGAATGGGVDRPGGFCGSLPKVITLSAPAPVAARLKGLYSAGPWLLAAEMMGPLFKFTPHSPLMSKDVFKKLQVHIYGVRNVVRAVAHDDFLGRLPHKPYDEP